MTTEKNYVEFYSPGTFVSECSRRPIAAWDILAAIELANGITERHSAKPYAFRFVTMLEGEPVSDGRGGTLNVQPRELKKSALHWLGGEVRTYDEVCAANLPDESILRDNMRCNRMSAIVVNKNSWQFTGEFNTGDVIVGPDGAVVRRGDEPELLAIKERMMEARK